MDGKQKLILNTVTAHMARLPGRQSKLFAASEEEVSQMASYLMSLMPGAALSVGDDGDALVVSHANGHAVWLRVQDPEEFRRQMAKAAPAKPMDSFGKIYPPTVTLGPPPEKG